MQKYESETSLKTNKLQSQSLKQLQFIISSERVYVRAFQQVHILNYQLVLHNCYHARNTYGYGVLIGHRER